MNRVKGYYKDSGIEFNSVVSTNQLKYFVRSEIDLFYAKKASGNDDIFLNLEGAKEWLSKNYPLIVALVATAPNNKTNYEHVVVLFKYDGNKKILYYFDPYYGEVGEIDASSKNMLSKYVQGNLPFLRIYPN